MVRFFVNWRQMILLSLFALLATNAFAQEQDPDPMVGKKLFNANCAACHKLNKKAVGPALRGGNSKI